MSATKKPDDDDEAKLELNSDDWRKLFGGNGDKPADHGPEPKGNGPDLAGGSTVPDFPILAEKAFHGPIGEIVRTVAPHTESDPALLLVGGLTYFGNVLGRGPHTVVEGTSHSPNFDVLFVGETSKSRKGTGDGRLRQIFKIAAPAWCGCRIKSGLSSGEGLINEVRDPVIKMVKGEEKIVDEGVDDKRLLIVQSEFGGALNAMKREGSLLSTVLRDAWDGRDLATLVKQFPLRATNPHISVIGHVTKTELVYLLDQVSMANGLANRFMFCCVKRSKLLPFGGALDRAEVTRLGAEIGHAIERAGEIGEVTWSRGSAESLGGAEGWERIYERLSEAKPGLVGALTARAEAQVIRLAMTYALWDGSASIDQDHLMAAAAVWDYADASVRYVFGEKVGNPVADSILAALRNAYPEGLTRTDISNLFARNVEAGAIATALQELQGLGLATVSRRAPNGRGRPVEVWTYRG
jgi:hypothetical protein